MKITINPSSNPISPTQRDQYLEAPGFGKYFTDHMAVAEWNQSSGWSDLTISALWTAQFGSCCNGFSLWARNL